MAATAATALTPSVSSGDGGGGGGGSGSNASNGNGSGSSTNEFMLKLHSPAGAEPIIFNWPITNGFGKDRHDRGGEITETIKWVCEDFPELKHAMEKNILKDYDVRSFDSMKNLCHKYNSAIDQILLLEKGTSKAADRLKQRASRGLLKHIIHKVYNIAVTDPEKLNQYEPFSPEVYGETSYEWVTQIIDQVHLTEDDVFIDLGSGVGQVVLQFAGLTPCKVCLGIEKAEVPSSYAVNMDRHFRKWMKWYGKKFNEYQLMKGDFLAGEMWEKITSATFVFVNNFAFGPTVDHMLKERFADLKDGARIVSSKAFCPLNFRITERTLSDIGSIMHINELERMHGNVSWTNKPVTYYCHRIDRTKLARYFESKNGAKFRDDESALIKTRGKCITNGSLNGIKSLDTSSNDSNSQRAQILDDDLDYSDDNSNSNGLVTGPTTRRAWSDWCSNRGKSSDDERNNSAPNHRSQSLGQRKRRGKKLRKKFSPKAKNDTKRGVDDSRKSGKLMDIYLPPPPIQSTGRGGCIQLKAKGRLKKTKTKKPGAIAGLDLLHDKTLKSTITQDGEKIPAAPGCVDQKLTQLTAVSSLGVFKHEELTIPSSDTPYALQKLLDLFKSQMLRQVEVMKTPGFKQQLLDQIEIERKRKEYLVSRCDQVNGQIDRLIKDSTVLLRNKLEELNIPGEGATADTLLSEARDIVVRHKCIQAQVTTLQEEVAELERANNTIVEERKQEIIQHCRRIGLLKDQMSQAEIDDFCLHYVLREISTTLAQRKQLESKIAQFEPEVLALEQKITVLNQQQQQIQSQQRLLALPPPSKATINAVSPKSVSNQKRERTIHRSRSTEWPEIPEVDIINEKNPEVLAQKILETGRKIEQLPVTKSVPSNTTASRSLCNQNHGRSNETANKISKQPHTLNTIGMKQQSIDSAVLTPKVSFFEDHLHNLITTCLKEDGDSGNKLNNQRLPVTINTSSISPRAFSNHTSPITKPPRQSPSHSLERKKKIQLSPDITTPFSNNAHSRGSPAKTALRAHLISSQDKEIRKDTLSHSHPQQLYFNPEYGKMCSRTIGDVVNGVVESLATKDLSTKSPPIRTNLYSPISRPNSNENPTEAASLPNAVPPQINLTNNYQERASVLVSAKNSTATGDLVEVSNKVTPQPHECMEGLALRTYMSSISKNPTLLGKSVEKGVREPVMELLNSPLVKEKKIIENSSGRVVTEVLLGNPDEEAVFDESGSTLQSSSVLRVVRKRLSDSINGIPVPPKKQAIVALASPTPSSNYSLSGTPTGVPPTPSPKPGSCSSSRPGSANQSDYGGPSGYGMSSTMSSGYSTMRSFNGTPPLNPSRVPTPGSLSRFSPGCSSAGSHSRSAESSKPYADDFSGSRNTGSGDGPKMEHSPRVDSPTKQWQNKISSNFEKLFCFASEIDRRRKSTEAAAAAASTSSSSANGNNSPRNCTVSTSTKSPISSSQVDLEKPKTPSVQMDCTTSPDSGIGKDLSLADTWLNQQQSSRDGSDISSSSNCVSTSKANLIPLPRTPSPSHVDEDDDINGLEPLDSELGLSSLIKAEDHSLDEPPPTPRLIHSHRHHHHHHSHKKHGNSSSDAKSNVNVSNPDFGQASNKNEYTNIKKESDEPTKPTEFASSETQQQQRPHSSAPSSGDLTAPTSAQQLQTQPPPASTPTSHNNNVGNSGTGGDQQHFKKRWNNWGSTNSNSGGTTDGRSSVASDCSSIASTSTIGESSINVVAPQTHQSQLILQQNQQLPNSVTPEPMRNQQTSGGMQMQGTMEHNANSTTTSTHVNSHPVPKFRPKGKFWDWNNQNQQQQLHDQQQQALKVATHSSSTSNHCGLVKFNNDTSASVGTTNNNNMSRVSSNGSVSSPSTSGHQQTPNYHQQQQQINTTIAQNNPGVSSDFSTNSHPMNKGPVNSNHYSNQHHLQNNAQQSNQSQQYSQHQQPQYLHQHQAQDKQIPVIGTRPNNQMMNGVESSNMSTSIHNGSGPKPFQNSGQHYNQNVQFQAHQVRPGHQMGHHHTPSYHQRHQYNNPGQITHANGNVHRHSSHTEPIPQPPLPPPIEVPPPPPPSQANHHGHQPQYHANAGNSGGYPVMQNPKIHASAYQGNMYSPSGNAGHGMNGQIETHHNGYDHPPIHQIPPRGYTSFSQQQSHHNGGNAYGGGGYNNYQGGGPPRHHLTGGHRSQHLQQQNPHMSTQYHHHNNNNPPPHAYYNNSGGTGNPMLPSRR